MIRSALSILLILLWYSNSYLTDWLHPYTDQDKYEFFVDWYYVRCNIYEVMFMLGAIISLMKKDRLSTAIISGALVLFIGSVTDKLLQGFYEYHGHDVWAFFCALLISYKVYNNGTR